MGNQRWFCDVFKDVTLKRCVATLTAVAGCAFGMAVPAAAVAAVPHAAAAIPRGLVPVATSWTSPRSGLVLAYPAQNPGARPDLLVTGDSGRTWRSLPAPPVPYPADNDQPGAIWLDGVIAVTDGTHIVVTRDSGRRWSALRAAGVSGTFFVGDLTIASGRVFALVQAQRGGTGSATVYSGPVSSGVLRPVPGLAISGSLAYGDISVTGALQVVLGAGYAIEKYWYSRDGVHFVSAAAPCPVTTVALLGGERGGRVTALCNGSPSDVAPGENDKQVWTAARLGGAFAPSGPVFDSPNQQEFAAASARDMAVATTFTLSVTRNAGRTWTNMVSEPGGGFWSGLSFQTASTGVAVVTTVNDALRAVGYVYRTTDAGRTWRVLPLP